MIIKLMDNWELHLNMFLRKQYWREGVNTQSFEEPEKHMLLWDFDNADLANLINELSCLQMTYELPTIYIIESSLKHYHGYCFAKRTFKEIIHILSDTEDVCIDFLRIGIVRGYFTLRISKREGDYLKLVKRIISIYPDEMLPSEVTLNDYITYNKGGKKNA